MALLLLIPALPGWAFAPDPFQSEPVATNEPPPPLISREDVFSAEEPTSFLKFLAGRTQLGLGYDAVFDDNVFLKDNDDKDDIIQTVEGILIFNDPRGSILYGAQYEVNAFRYIRQNANAVNHDLVAYFDLDPGGRTRFRADYNLDVNNGLTFGTVGVDILRTGADFQRTVEHKGSLQIKYTLSQRNSLSTAVSYLAFDDQTANDASTDRQKLRSTLDFNHELTPIWTVFTGTAFEKISVPGDKLKNDDTYAGRLGTRYDLGPSEKLDVTFELRRPKFKEKERETDPSFTGSWTHLINPRATLTAGYTDKRVTSFATGRSQFRSRIPQVSVAYLLTPRVTTTLSGSYEKQKSGSSDSASGTALVHRQHNLRAGLKWQVREQMFLTLDYSNTRSKSRDITSRIFSFGVETSF